MLNKIWRFCCDRGYVFMAAGMLIIIAAAVMLIRSRQAAETPSILLWPIAAAGLLVYIIGRIGVAFRNRRKQKESLIKDLDSSE